MRNRKNLYQSRTLYRTGGAKYPFVCYRWDDMRSGAIGITTSLAETLS